MRTPVPAPIGAAIDGASAPRLSAYRRSGADLPFSSPERWHGVAMEGYFWRFTDVAAGRSVIVLHGVNRPSAASTEAWSTIGVASWPDGGLITGAWPGAQARVHQLGARNGSIFCGTDQRVTVDLEDRVHIDVAISQHQRWPSRLLGGSSVFQMVPALNQYWHPWLLGGRADGVVEIDGTRYELDGAQAYGEKNWGRGGFPDSWWWGQAHGFTEPGASIAFAGGDVSAGPFRTEVTGLVARLPDGTVMRLGNPGISPVRADVGHETWELCGRSARWQIDVHAAAPLGDAHVLPVPLPTERRNTAGAIEHLGGHLEVTVRQGRTEVWSGVTDLAGLEHGGLDRVAAELRRRGAPAGATDHRPMVRRS
ncbi:hypothetical protein JOD52_001957 [Brachybacterium muris]|uniref:tocopherol cyclase family protein n=1 Tax=Brachybacterium muris TaxID=219301 RepID=UPI0005A5DD9B|nr:tocopherol cyclase family protein [Brachybacterium muris]MBM7501117.1 hypothetical protein [Brachybacterium muris]MCT1653750.1 tocopherol cyclase family protein [Brachybacterium muris]MCT2296488.1 tocopherol cyclase family protein [Brachybacterium muris]